MRTKQEWLKIWGPVVVVLLLGFGITAYFIQPPPPTHLRIATGGKQGAYYQFGETYRKHLAKAGITLEVLPSAGSVENIELLRRGEVDLAFVQGGTVQAQERETLHSLASLFYEPLWVFHRKEISLQHLYDLKGKKLATGASGSGTRRLVAQLLEHNGISMSDAEWLPLTAEEAARQLEAGEIDAAFFVSSPRSSFISRLLTSSEVALMSFDRHEAYERIFPFLASLSLGEGMVNLAANVPDKKVRLLAPTAVLVASNDIHPALVGLILEVATKAHYQGGLFEPANAFPSSSFADLPMNAEASKYLESGPSWLQRVLPFWLASLLDRLKIMLVPLLTLLIPLLKVTPPLYRWRIRSKIFKWYRALRKIDQQVVKGTNFDYQAAMKGLLKLEKELNEVSVPYSYMGELYDLRVHLNLVINELKKMAGD